MPTLMSIPATILAMIMKVLMNETIKNRLKFQFTKRTNTQDLVFILRQAT